MTKHKKVLLFKKTEHISLNAQNLIRISHGSNITQPIKQMSVWYCLQNHFLLYDQELTTADDLQAVIGALSAVAISNNGFSSQNTPSSNKAGSPSEYIFVYLQRLRTPDPSSSALPILLKNLAIIRFLRYGAALRINARNDRFCWCSRSVFCFFQRLSLQDKRLNPHGA